MKTFRRGLTMAEKLLNCRQKRPSAKYVLVCFPWAGGGSNWYGRWAQLLPETIEVCAIRLPGRENRFQEPCYKDPDTYIQDVTAAVYKYVSAHGTALAIWGHSLGSYMGYEVAKQLQEKHGLDPVHLFFSGASAPHSEKRKLNQVKTAGMSDEEFVENMRRLGGTPREILDDKEMMKLFLPSLRADFCILENYWSSYDKTQVKPFSCPISVFDGSEDRPHDLEAWSDLSDGPFHKMMLKGGHFYLIEEANTRTITEYIAANLT
ncbi:S-acyl fatty acid synthase thioesterase, medium chain-like isoform X2 [Lingula anatina]|nr:S-acyl fatty acid synthase thioesterase, medium chain-like isoform X2 [Lingula anatina]XP_013381251.1 S-acyl fatty acid synthase thioesterase, medium chain-like isoform X2 [Lingula anatina]XP_013381252.1 S-acyl fatty acid synthase thioesterase, medium chain-like isoform X2 [Lingula anatina]|eukprot:XP_013381250.1 S-acyl fatty acid synthase thioesterase, medium chain-like isoform X2 [Lingula anatina]